MKSAFRQTIFTKPLLILSIPLIVQGLLIYKISQDLDKEERISVQLDRARDEIDTVNRIYAQEAMVGNELFRLVDSPDGLDELFERNYKDFLKDANHLRRLLRDNPKQLAELKRKTDSAKKFVSLAHFVKGERKDDFSVEHSQFRGQKIKELRECGIAMAVPLTIDEATKDILEASSRNKTNVESERQETMKWLLPLNVILTLVTALLLFRFIIKPLELLRDNSLRIAAQRPLNPPLPGDDEIAELDQAFHRMAESLQEASIKARAMLDNAHDLICSLDAKGIFEDVGDACEKILGFSRAELLGSRMINMIVDEDKNYVFEKIKSLADGNKEPPFEARLLRKEQIQIYTLWSCTWSAQDKSLSCVVQDISERKQAQRLRQDVLQMVSHDLRGPLFSIRGVLEMLGEGMVGEINQKGQQLIQRAEFSADMMLTLVNDLLDMERLEAGMLQLDRSSIDIPSLFEQVEQTTMINANKKQIDLQFRASVSDAYADKDRLVQILVNLISNAIKFSETGGRVIVSARQGGEMVEFSVKDDGRGIPGHKINSIFDRFKQVERSDSKGSSGSGLGLAICKALVELHGGNISVSSSPGKGSTFSFRLPNHFAESKADARADIS